MNPQLHLVAESALVAFGKISGVATDHRCQSHVGIQAVSCCSALDDFGFQLNSAESVFV